MGGVGEGDGGHGERDDAGGGRVKVYVKTRNLQYTDSRVLNRSTYVSIRQHTSVSHVDVC